MKLAPLVITFLGLQHGSSAARMMTVGDCDDLQAAASATASEDVVAEFTQEFVICDSWTTFEITNNRLKIVAGEAVTDEDGIFLRNVRFSVPSGVLRIDPKVSFYRNSGDDENVSQELNGGVLNVGEGARARFMSLVYCNGMVLSTGTSDPSEVTGDAGNGACFYNKGLIRFEDGVQAFYYSTTNNYELAGGDGGALWNGETGRVVFKGRVDMGDNRNSIRGDSKGGAIYNAGKVSVFGDTYIGSVAASVGGVIYNSGVFKFLKGSTVVLESGFSSLGGGHVYNTGTMLLKGTGAFLFGYANDASGGSVYNTGTFTISGVDGDGIPAAEFSNCGAEVSGGAIFTAAGATLEIPDDTVFDSNYIISDLSGVTCDDIYQETDEGFTCLP